MATVTPFRYRQGNPDGNGRNSSVMSGFATIDINETATLPIYCGGRALVRLGFPSAFTGTTVTFTVQAFPSSTIGGTTDPAFRPLYDDAGNQISVTVSTNRSIEVPELSGAYAFTIVSGSAEAAAREIEVQCIGSQPTTPANNKISIEGSTTVTANQGTAGATAWPTRAAAQTGVIYSGSTAVTPVFAPISGASSGDNTLVAADATKKIRVFALSVVAAGAVTVRFESAAGGTALTGVMSFAANGGYVLPFNPAGWFETAVNQLLNMELGGAVQVSGHLTYGLV